jgi:hypothetical protein
MRAALGRPPPHTAPPVGGTRPTSYPRFRVVPPTLLGNPTVNTDGLAPGVARLDDGVHDEHERRDGVRPPPSDGGIEHDARPGHRDAQQRGSGARPRPATEGPAKRCTAPEERTTPRPSRPAALRSRSGGRAREGPDDDDGRQPPDGRPDSPSPSTTLPATAPASWYSSLFLGSSVVSAQSVGLAGEPGRPAALAGSPVWGEGRPNL